MRVDISKLQQSLADICEQYAHMPEVEISRWTPYFVYFTCTHECFPKSDEPIYIDFRMSFYLDSNKYVELQVYVDVDEYTFNYNSLHPLELAEMYEGVAKVVRHLITVYKLLVPSKYRTPEYRD